MALNLSESEQVAAIVQAAREKKAFDESVLDLRGLASYTEYFVIVSGSTTRQVWAIAEAILAGLASRGVKPLHLEGINESEWVLIDFNAVVVHIFTPSRREFYDLDRLWADAKKIVVKDEREPPRNP